MFFRMKQFTGNEAADYLGIHRQTFKNWKRSGKVVPSLDRGNIAFYDQTYLDEIKKKIQETGAEATQKKF